MASNDDALSSLSTIRDFIRWGASRFREAGLTFGHGTDNALDEAAVLVAHAVHLPPGLPEHYLAATLTPSEREAVTELLVRRVRERKPAPYLTHEAWFGGLSFYVDERVLVPRSPIAELVENAFAPWVVPENVGCILDMCTGSGCIAIACAQAFPHALVDAADISAEALAVAQINVERYALQDRVRLIQSDLFDSLDGGGYDIIVSNPPYVPTAEFAQLPEEYRYEPRLGLESGAGGLAAALEILRRAPDYLRAGGILVVEVGYSAEALVQRLPQVPFFWLDFARGGEGVFLLTAEQIREHRDLLRNATD